MRSLHILTLIAFVALTTAAIPASGITPYLVRDINPETQPASSSPYNFVSLGSTALFTTGVHTNATLWRTDGTAGGTYKLLEDFIDFKLLAVAGGRCYFSSGSENLWVTDGTLPGTYHLGLPHSISMPERPRSVWLPGQRSLYFTGSSYWTDMELWRTDGTPGGTFQVADIRPGDLGSDPRELTSFQGKVYFVADGPLGDPALWRSDGTAQGTIMVSGTATVPNAETLHKIGSKLIFAGKDPAHGEELWVSDGTPKGTRLLMELVKGPGSPELFGFTVHGQRLYFTASSISVTPQLWVTDGTAGGTRALTRFANEATIKLLQSAPSNRFIFMVSDASHGTELWATDGTEVGTRLVRDICPGSCSSLDPHYLFYALHKGWLYFNAFKPSLGRELWATDGTGKGTHLVRDICPGSCGSSPRGLVTMKGHVLFQASDGIHQNQDQVWATDGTGPGTVALASFDGSLWFQMADYAVAGSMMVFAGGSDSRYGREPWCTDGTPGGTFLLADLADEDLGGSNPGGLMAIGNTALFFADDGKHGYTLWKSDGNAEGTSFVAELQAGPAPFRRPEIRDWTSFGGRVYFFLEKASQNDSLTREANVKFPPPPKQFALWTSDGTAAGTYRLTPKGVHGWGYPKRLPLTSQFFFTANDSQHGTEPWVTDGTPAGTRMLADLEPGSTSSGPTYFTLFQGKVWFVTHHGTANQLWQSDGTAAGTVLVEPELPGNLVWGPRYLSVFNRQIWFLAQWDNGQRTELWSTDGTPGGARLKVQLDFNAYGMFADVDRLFLWGSTSTWVSDGTPGGTLEIAGTGMSEVRSRCGSLLYFGTPLMVTDGTRAGTRTVRSVNDEQISLPRGLACLGSSLLALSWGGQLWQTDGTDAGTVLVRDLSHGKSGHLELLQVGPRGVFSSWDPKTGWELWAAQN